MNHSLTEEQRIDAAQSLGIDEVVQAPKEILDLWGNIPPELSAVELRERLRPIFDWVMSIGSNNVILIQGEAVSTYMVAKFVHERYSLYGTFCVAATSRRETIEEKLNDGSIKKTAIFKHVRFRPYF
jgi:hypothetical protein